MPKLKSRQASDPDKKRVQSKTSRPVNVQTRPPLDAFNPLKSHGALSSAHVRVHPALKEYFGYCLYKVAVQVRYLLDGALAEHHLIAPHFGILRLLKTEGPQNQVTICDSLSIDRASMVKLIDILEDLDLVGRTECPDDRRAKIVKLTPRGLTKAEVILKVAQQIELKMMDRLSKQEQEILRKAIPKLLDFSLG